MGDFGLILWVHAIDWMNLFLESLILSLEAVVKSTTFLKFPVEFGWFFEGLLSLLYFFRFRIWGFGRNGTWKRFLEFLDFGLGFFELFLVNVELIFFEFHFFFNALALINGLFHFSDLDSKLLVGSVEFLNSVCLIVGCFNQVEYLLFFLSDHVNCLLKFLLVKPRSILVLLI